ncbi:PREDICTED: uncharacterized protein LOC109222144, partial [Nicotiana attenuata]|uniref:uncharacterized protein LOC109222144 n=1 Tax=Nicotiana attenuata TaxID=49451 RepID=UPI00090578DD
LKTVVDLIVGHAQSAFIEGRSILDNVIIAHELVKGYNKKGVSPRCIIKVDIRKAYDSVEWPFLEMVLQEYGFPNKMNADGMLIQHNDALVVSLLVQDTNVKRVLIYLGSSVNIILLRVVNGMQGDNKL